jgi:hypothetical protein
MHPTKPFDAPPREPASCGPEPCSPPPCSLDELICQWLVRLLLPPLLAGCGLVVFWTCFDNVYGVDLLSILGGALIALVSLPIAAWAWDSWSRG